MNIIELFNTFKTQEQALEYLEKVRWRGEPNCPYCGSLDVGRHASGDRAQQRWQCRDCTRAFAVTVGTIFHGTHLPLRSWFLVLALMVNAKKSASAYQIARDLGMRRPTVWSMMHRIRTAMQNDTMQSNLLHGIVEADETYIGGKPRKINHHGDDDAPKAKRGRGTKKTPVIGVVERLGRVIATPAASWGLTSGGLAKFISRFVDKNGTLLVTDENSAYEQVGKTMNHSVIRHKESYVNGLIHTNTIEGFWSLVKRAWYGQHHHYSKKYIALYISEACFKYNNRSNNGAFATALGAMVAI